MIWLFGFLAFYVICAVSIHWIGGTYSGDRYWSYDWDEPEKISEITHRLRVPPPGKL